MDKTIFYAPEILLSNTLPADESAHCVRVLRKKEGDEILITDGKGHFFDSTITDANQKKCTVIITSQIDAPCSWNNDLQIAFAPTKNIDRIEWFAEKATEIGINRLSPIICEHSERKEVKSSRIEKILVSAMKQSQKGVLPLLDEQISFSQFIKKEYNGQKFIAHCHETKEKKPFLKNIYKKNSNVLILIGPEGDFSKKEVEEAKANGYIAISLGNSRLRTETAALVACDVIQNINQ